MLTHRDNKVALVLVLLLVMISRISIQHTAHISNKNRDRRFERLERHTAGMGNSVGFGIHHATDIGPY